jgi:hypothetical protein
MTILVATGAAAQTNALTRRRPNQIAVNPKHTSQAFLVCDRTAKGNRDKRKHQKGIAP